jgi:hypothetical protein
MVRDDKTPQGETLPYGQTQITRSRRRGGFIVMMLLANSGSLRF